MMYREKIKSVFSKLKNIWEKNDKSDRLFLLSFISFILVSLIFFTFRADSNLFLIPILLGSVGIIKELRLLFEKLWDHSVSKAFLLLAYAFVINLSLLLSSKMINLLTGVESKYFFYSSTMLAMLNSIPLAYIISLLILLIMSPYVVYSFMLEDAINTFKSWFSQEKTSETNRHFIKVYRVFFYTFLPIYLFSSVGFINTYLDQSYKIVNWTIYNLEANEKSFCQLDKDERSIMVGNDVLAIKKVPDDNITYTMKKCVKIY